MSNTTTTTIPSGVWCTCGSSTGGTQTINCPMHGPFIPTTTTIGGYIPYQTTSDNQILSAINELKMQIAALSAKVDLLSSKKSTKKRK